MEVAQVYENRVWIESDLYGSKHVMVQSECHGSNPFQYATFFYQYGYTDNATVRAAAHALALSLGAQEPIEERMREFDLPNANSTSNPTVKEE